MVLYEDNGRGSLTLSISIVYTYAWRLPENTKFSDFLRIKDIIDTKVKQVTAWMIQLWWVEREKQQMHVNSQ